MEYPTNMADLRPPMPVMSDLFRLDGRTAVITGGASGIGRGTAHALAQAGAHVVVADYDHGLATQTATEVDGEAVEIDITNEAAVVGLFRDLTRCDVLVTCAGKSLRAPSLDTSLDDWNAVVDVNLTSTFLCAREAARRMLDGGGSIIAMASIMGHVGGSVFPNPAYHASKGGVVNLVRALAVEWAEHDIRVNAVAPTFVETPFIAPLFDQHDTVDQIINTTPLGRMATSTDVAAAVLYLASPASGMVTGTSLAVDGGWLAQ
ncbi:MAG: SDR family oxidoreductase [Ilumatobacter sp.]|nr:SDR family oxidoreductase [Ilumatobacter sp.]